jgi:hypothetical protein
MRHRATPGQWHDLLAYQSWALVHHDGEPPRRPARTGQQSVPMGHAGRSWDRAGRTCRAKSVINDRLIAAVTRGARSTMYLTTEAAAISSGLPDRQFGVRGGAEVTAPATKTQLILDHLLGRPTPHGA